MPTEYVDVCCACVVVEIKRTEKQASELVMILIEYYF